MLPQASAPTAASWCALVLTSPAEHDLVLLGGGHSHLAVLRRWAMRPQPGVRLTLVARELHTPYSGMLPGLIAGHYGFDAAHVDLGPLAVAAGARLIHAEVSGLDAAGKFLHFGDRPPLRYDTLSINSGATPAVRGVSAGVDQLRLVKPISRFLPAFDAVLRRLEAAVEPLAVVVVGGGPGGVELVLAFAHRLTRAGMRDRARLMLATASARVLEGHGPGVAGAVERELERAGVSLAPAAEVVKVESGRLVCADGRRLAADETFWVTGVEAPPWLTASGLAVDAAGFVEVGETLQSVSHEDVFAAGDVAALRHAPRPKSGVYAVRAGAVLARNLPAWIRGERLRRFRPQRRALYLISTGDRRAVVSRPGLPPLLGSWVWRWKDRIDRRFMARYQELAPMDPRPPRSVVAASRGGQRLAAGMRCRGCGGKVAVRPLAEALAKAGIGDGRHFEDAAELPVPGQLLQQTIDGFPLPVSDPYLGGRLAALHALGDLHAMGADPLGALALAGIPYAGEAQMAADLTALMAGAERELRLAGCALLGGHSCESEAISLGLALTGRIPDDDRGRVLRKDRLQPGQVLVLTKPLGTGALLAAAASGRTASRHVEAALASMLQSNGPALAQLRRFAATACTDVTGFGLLGHALEMASASGCALEFHADRISALPGALEAIGADVVSSLQAANEDVLEHAVLAAGIGPGDPSLRLLCDPQTCGGLLFSVPEAVAQPCVAALRQAGFNAAAVVGRVVAATSTRPLRILTEKP